jgi:uncharacterized membrane protein
MFEEWTASDWIAIGSLLVALAAIVSTALVAWWRMRHEERMQDERLVHERRESLTTAAVAAFESASEALQMLGMKVDADNYRETMMVVDAARRDLEVIAVVGWSEEVREAASDLRLSLTWVLLSRDPTSEGQWVIEPWDRAQEVLARYREAIGREEG